MISSPHAQTDTLKRAARQLECRADEARWEAQLRKLAGRQPIADRPVAAPRFALVRTALELATRVSRRDALIIPRTLPAFSGNGIEDLVCGQCSDVIGMGVTLRVARREHPEGDRLVVRCTCGALNLLTRA